MSPPEAKYMKAVQAVNAAAVTPGGWPRALETLSNYVGGIGAMLVCHDLKRNEHWLVAGGLDSDIARLYLDQHTDNVFTREMTRRGPGIYGAHELTDMNSLRRTSFFADVWAPQRIETLVQMAHPSMTNNGASGGVAVALSAAQAEDLPDINRRWRRIAPQLRLATDLYIARSERQRSTDANALLLEILEEAAFVVSADGRILDFNDEAKALLQAGVVVRHNSRRHLEIVDDADMRQLRVALSRAAHISRLGSVFRLTESDRLVVHVAPVPEVDSREQLTGPGRALVRFIDIRADHRRRAAVAAQLFSLSEAEVRVLSFSVRGKPAPAVAHILGLSPATVRSHLKHIFEKTGVRSQAELAQMVARLPNG